jgi:hypothetical protein
MSGVQFSVGQRDFPVLHCVRSGFRAQPAPHTVGTRGSFPQSKEADEKMSSHHHLVQSSRVVELYRRSSIRLNGMTLH